MEYRVTITRTDFVKGKLVRTNRTIAITDNIDLAYELADAGNAVSGLSMMYNVEWIDA